MGSLQHGSPHRRALLPGRPICLFQNQPLRSACGPRRQTHRPGGVLPLSLPDHRAVTLVDCFAAWPFQRNTLELSPYGVD